MRESRNQAIKVPADSQSGNGVIMVVDKAPPDYGGAGAQALLLAEELNANGRTVRIFSRKRRRGQKNNDRIHYLGPGCLGDGIFSNIVFALQVFTVVVFSPEPVVHIHGAYYYGFTAALAGKLRRKKIVIKVTLLGKDDPASIAQVVKGYLPVGKALVMQFRWADKVIALNATIAAVCTQHLGLQKVVTLPNAVEVSRLRACRSDRPENTIIFCGAISSRKGADVLIDSWKLVSDKLPDWRLELAGPIRNDVRAAVLAATDVPTLRVHYLGEMTQEESWYAMGVAKIFVLPSQAEGLSNSLIEARALGLACVVSDIPVNRDVCGESAWYVPVGDVAMLAQSLFLAASSSDCSKQSALVDDSLFSVTNLARRYSEIYDYGK